MLEPRTAEQPEPVQLHQIIETAKAKERARVLGAVTYELHNGAMHSFKGKKKSLEHLMRRVAVLRDAPHVNELSEDDRVCMSSCVKVLQDTLGFRRFCMLLRQHFPEVNEALNRGDL